MFSVQVWRVIDAFYPIVDLFSLNESRFLIHERFRDTGSGARAFGGSEGRGKRARTPVSSSARGDEAPKSHGASKRISLSKLELGRRVSMVVLRTRGGESGELNIVRFGGEIRKLLPDLRGKGRQARRRRRRKGFDIRRGCCCRSRPGWEEVAVLFFCFFPCFRRRENSSYGERLSGCVDEK
jgi:hypothetical protein